MECDLGLRTAVIGTALLLFWAGAGCAPATVCEAGDSRACRCPGGSEGTTACRQDGGSWEPCVCLLDGDLDREPERSDQPDLPDEAYDAETGDGDPDLDREPIPDTDPETSEPDGSMVCAPACAPVVEECANGDCVCAAGFQDGGEGGCVPRGSCADGYGIPPGGSECVPVERFCDDLRPCADLFGWSTGDCLYRYHDGRTCPGDHPPPACADGFVCRRGRCIESWPACAGPQPVVMVHGINGGPHNFATMIERLVADGWPRERLYTFAAEDPAWGCNLDNAAAIAALVERARSETCSPRVDLIAHSMGTLSSRHYIKFQGGTERVASYITLGGMHHGLDSSCWSPLDVCVWKEICSSGPFVAALNADPATPGPVWWMSIYGTADENVPNGSSILDGAENIAIEGATHDNGQDGLLDRQDAYEHVRRGLGYPCPE